MFIIILLYGRNTMIDKNYLITYSSPKSPMSEAYRVLRTNIQFSGFDRTVKVILVTSSEPEEGKTTTVSNLAVTFAQSGNKVILIDADLRKPMIHKIFGLAGRRGLTNAIIDYDNYRDYINENVFNNLDILTCGIIPPNPSEILSSNVMKKLMERVRDDYDYVFIDSPPAGTVTDAAVISTIADTSLLVVLSRKVRIENIKRAKELLLNVKANIAGVILNKYEIDNHKSYYYYYRNDNDGQIRRRRRRPEKLEKKEKAECL
jgi:protein-tyrosine kinase